MKKRKTKGPVKCFFAIDLQIYPQTLYFSVGQTDKELITSMKRRKCGNLMFTGLDYGGDTCPAKYTVWAGALIGLIRMRELPETSKMFGALAHEITHITNHFMEMIGMALDNNTSGEAYAYLNGWLTMRIYQELNKYY